MENEIKEAISFTIATSKIKIHSINLNKKVQYVLTENQKKLLFKDLTNEGIVIENFF